MEKHFVRLKVQLSDYRFDTGLFSAKDAAGTVKWALHKGGYVEWKNFSMKHKMKAATLRKKAKKIRPQILSRQNGKCFICGSREFLEVHHIVHLKDGGTNHPNNLQALCRKCHLKQHE